ncbi:hypothetical protein NEMBOFW57_005084 [Staphylotrichum longicolle]|uniref:Uncharacterized protein n=1 Tax=Staphylotrichum longicolle TaxID=669026 RepID=A0AAD4F0Q1_9PEZI|nr:hypothetical protein NEMBOFW57_005084 [Staphylotrichum longicolle]
MREANQHIMVHCRVSMDGTEFIGSLAYEEHIHEDDALFRKSHSDPVPVRTSLAPQDDGLVPIGHITADGESAWYMYDQQEGIVYLEPGVFFRAGEGASEHIRFWNPVQNQICRASFQGAERPPTRSPDPQPVNLEAAMSELSIAAPPPQPTVEWVRPELQLDKNRAKPVAFSTQAGLKLRTGWERWKVYTDDGRWTFVCVGVKTGNQYWAEYLPGEWVEPAWVQSSKKPIQFSNTQGELIKTTRSKWLAGQDDTFFVYMQQGKAYLTMARLPDD